MPVVERIKKELIKYWKEEAKKRGTLEEFARWHFWSFFFLSFANCCVLQTKDLFFLLLSWFCKYLCNSNKRSFFQDHAVTQSLPLLWLRREWGGNFKYSLKKSECKEGEDWRAAFWGQSWRCLPCCHVALLPTLSERYSW